MPLKKRFGSDLKWGFLSDAYIEESIGPLFCVEEPDGWDPKDFLKELLDTSQFQVCKSDL